MNSHLETSNANKSSNDMSWVTCYVGLGSNLENELGSPIEHLQQAIVAMQENKQIRAVRVSSFYASAPMGPQDQPDFVNAVVGFETTLTAFELLAFCQALEQQPNAPVCAAGVSAASMSIFYCMGISKSQSRN